MTRVRKLLLDLVQLVGPELADWPEGLESRFDAVNVHEALNDREPLDKVLVLGLLAAIPDGTPFVVVFQTTKGDVREMLCIRETDVSPTSSKRPEHSNVYTVWDREKKAPRAFRLDHVYRIEVSGR